MKARQFGVSGSSPGMALFLLWTVLVFRVCFATTSSATETNAVPEATTLEHETTTATRKDDSSSWKNDMTMLIDWVRTHGGTVHEALEVRQQSSSSSSSPRRASLVAQRLIQTNELLWEIPLQYTLDPRRNNTIHHEDDHDLDEDMAFVCTATRQLVHEFQKNDESSIYGPWRDCWRHQATTNVHRIPSMWSEAGKDLLLQLVGWSVEYFENESDDDDDEPEAVATQILPPLDPTTWIDYDWKILCNGGDDNDNDDDDDDDNRLVHGAVLTVAQHRALRAVVPLMDWVTVGSVPNIRIDQTTNTNNMLQVWSTREIHPHEPLVRGHAEFEGTPETFRDWGYVEDLPHTFQLPGSEVRFVVDNKADQDEESSNARRVEVTLLEGVTVEELNAEFFDSELQRLRGFAQIYFLPGKPDTIPELEWTMLKEYYTAVEQGIRALTELKRTSECALQGDCRVVSFFDPLDEYVDTTIFDVEACDRATSLDLSRFEEVDVIQSPYQELQYLKDPLNEDVCFRLDGTLQICGNYRPHYHEMVVQYTSRYLKDVRRVLWVGGGDSMLLHEILKYPNLELAIGLELDQQVTRYSFKHFGSQPHWDDERVQWWYGDAAKSLLMLPKEYFGSFDMVLVDLSETVMSMTVTKDLDIMAALSLLIKPDGIFVKNEVYLQKLKDIFEYSVQVEIDDVPMLCAQTLVIGSNTIDFLNTDLTDHKVETFLGHLDDISKHDHFIIDAVRNPFAQQYCAADDEPMEPDEQESSPGLVMILEAENAQKVLGSAQSVKDAIFPTLENEGFHVLDTFLTDSNVPSATFVMAEGYVVATSWPNVKYCQFDIHLWSMYGNMDSLKVGLLKALGSTSQSASAFRIVTTGMFGAKTWKVDEMARGPVFTQDCQGRSEDTRSERMSDEKIDMVLRGYLNLIPWPDTKALIICGSPDQSCNSLSTVESHETIAQALPIYSCAGINHNMDFVENAEEILQSCEDQVWLALRAATISNSADDSQISVIVLDPSAPRAMARIFHKIASTPAMKDVVFSYDVVALAPIVDETDSWRRIFMDKFLEVWFQYPSARSEVLFNSTQNSIEMDAFISGDQLFLEHINATNSKIEDNSGLIADVRFIHSGMPRFTPGATFSQYFLPAAYDQSEPLKQWNSQQAVGLQTIFQMFGASHLTIDKVEHMLTSTLSAMKIAPSLTPHRFADIGEGVVTFTSWDGGRATVLWDGRDSIAINIFTFDEDAEFALDFAKHFASIEPSLHIALRDQMPRGYGRVVNFSRDVVGRKEVSPHWSIDNGPLA